MKKINISSESFEPLFEKIEKLSKIQRILIYYGTLIALIGMFVYFSYLPKFNHIEKLNNEYSKLAKELNSVKKVADQLENYRSQMKKAEIQFELVKKALPEKKEIPSLLAAVSRSGQEAGLDFLLFEPKAEIKKDFYAEIPVSIKVLGNYHDVAVFFDNVSRLSRIVNIEDIKMISQENAGKLTTQCTAVTYKFIDAPSQKTSKKKGANKKNNKKKKS
ncbi:MAG: type 4a pilus biogenesis protein PilO [Desulfobacterales bacterium]|nr:type 4a pilus biogenesis protein PilO [Desulfobacterales bacterium]